MGSSVAWVPHPGDVRKALVDGRREVICRGFNWGLRLEGRGVIYGEEVGEDMELKYDVGFPPRKGPNFLGSGP